jgi:hypothetical protein
MVFLTALSVMVAVMAAAIAIAANKEASNATSQAREANELARKANEIAVESNHIAHDASTFAKGVATDLAWDEAITAVAAIQTFDAAGHEPVGDRMVLIRTRLMLLIDRLDWDGFDAWIARELQCINVLARDAGFKGSAAGAARRDPEVALRLNEDFLTWVAGFTINLRFFRKTGTDHRALVLLTEQATKMSRSVCERNGWEVPPDDVPGLESLDLPGE